MKKDYLSREEDELFSRTVLDFNNSSQTNEKEKNKNTYLYCSKGYAPSLL